MVELRWDTYYIGKIHLIMHLIIYFNSVNEKNINSVEIKTSEVPHKNSGGMKPGPGRSSKKLKLIENYNNEIMNL